MTQDREWHDSCFGMKVPALEILKGTIESIFDRLFMYIYVQNTEKKSPSKQQRRSC